MQTQGEHAKLLMDSDPEFRIKLQNLEKTEMLPTATHYQSHIRSTNHSDEDMPLAKSVNLFLKNLPRPCGHQSQYVQNTVMPNICSEIKSCQAVARSFGYAIILCVNIDRQMVCISKLPNHWA